MKHTRQDLKIMQGWSLERKIRVTQTRIMEWYMRYDGQVFISFSGGKDSTVLLDLARRVYDWMKMTADAARNLFSWNSKCAATPFEISRMPAPAIRALFTACFIANGDYMVSVRENDKGEKVFEIDDSAGKRREAFNLQMEQMMEAPGMEPD